ncbi:MAG: transglutaminase domain-containing protein [Bacillota bacterium]
MDTHPLLKATRMADYRHPDLQALIEREGWLGLATEEKIRAIHAHVRDAVKFGYNATDRLKASDVYKQGYGQCNTKAVLLLALLRAAGVPARLRALDVESGFQKELVPKVFRPFMPKRFLHTQVLVEHEEKTRVLEGFILDRAYIEGVRRLADTEKEPFIGYAVATESIRRPRIEFQGGDTAIQSLAVVHTHGDYDQPETLHEAHRQNLGFLRRSIYANIVRHFMNRRAKKIRRQKTE